MAERVEGSKRQEACAKRKGEGGRLAATCGWKLVVTAESQSRTHTKQSPDATTDATQSACLVIPGGGVGGDHEAISRHEHLINQPWHPDLVVW